MSIQKQEPLKITLPDGTELSVRKERYSGELARISAGSLVYGLPVYYEGAYIAGYDYIKRVAHATNINISNLNPLPYPDCLYDEEDEGPHVCSCSFRVSAYPATFRDNIGDLEFFTTGPEYWADAFVIGLVRHLASQDPKRAAGPASRSD